MEKLTFNQLYKATREAIVHRNASIEDNALALLLERCGNDLLTISNQVEKLCLYTHSIKKEDVERLVPPRVEEDVFKLTNALLNHDLRNTMRVYQDLISKKHDPLELIGLIANALRNLYQVSIMSKRDIVIMILPQHSVLILVLSIQFVKMQHILISLNSWKNFMPCQN